MDGKLSFKITTLLKTIFFKNSIDETDWSLAMAQEIFNNEFECPGCHEKFTFTNIQKLQHSAVCKKKNDTIIEEADIPMPSSSLSSNLKLFNCTVCLKKMHLTNVEILKHKKICKFKKEIE